MASIWRPASCLDSFATNQDFVPLLSSEEHPSTPLNPLVFSLDFPIDFEAAQRSLSNPASQTKKDLVKEIYSVYGIFLKVIWIIY